MPSTPSSVFIRIDHARPLRHQIYTHVRRAIVQGLLAPGVRVPSSRALADELAVSRTTTLAAYGQLMAEGYLAGRRGSGTFVACDLPDARPMPGPRIARSTRAVTVSNRGAVLAAIPPPARRLAGPPRPFRVGTPALDLVPVRLWSRLAHRRLASVTRSHLDYGDEAGLPAFRAAIAAHVTAARGTRCDADHVIVTAGAQRGIELACRLLLDPGDRAWIEEPGYAGARSALVAAGARIVPVPVDAEGIDVDAGARLAGDARLACVTPSHQFPSGVAMSLSRRLALLKWAQRTDAWIIEDDYDSEFRYGTRAVPCLHGLDGEGRVIYVGTFAKSLFPALRLGFLIVPPALREAVLAARRAADVHPPMLDQAVLADLMHEGHYHRHLRRMRTAYRERLAALADALARRCGSLVRLRPVTAGLHAVADLAAVDAGLVAREAAKRSVEVMPLSAYFIGEPRDANALVLGFAAAPPESIHDAVDQLAAAIDAARRARCG
jgi:GntR family transcriptional regulator/MocR family aminotransferase